MWKFFKENVTLISGIALPVLLVILFYIFGEAAKKTVEDPRYAAVFVRDYYPNNDLPWTIKTEGGKIVASVRALKEGENIAGWTKPGLYVFDPKENVARRIELAFDTEKPGPATSPELDALNASGRIVDDPVSPDGYRFEYRSGYDGSLLGEVFGMRSGRNSYYVLLKPPRTVPITAAEPLYSATFLGWVVPENGPQP